MFHLFFIRSVLFGKFALLSFLLRFPQTRGEIAAFLVLEFILFISIYYTVYFCVTITFHSILVYLDACLHVLFSAFQFRAGGGSLGTSRSQVRPYEQE